MFQQETPEGPTLIGYVDADWASDVNDCKSMLRFIFMLARGTMSWSSKKQSSVALSSMEAEYITAAHAAKETVWLRHLLTKLKVDTHKPTVLCINNQSTIAIT
jgi:hypothetical protein